ncbi:hypothetical protein ABMA28_009394 [Loxostege sticticalis]|uniref:Uncharacterized protein n=1 Tax=Loxostege sticticalis TaxID=481309 RepID=A0ABD0SDR1_LOXSC
MTKMNGVNLPEMMGQQNLIVDDIFTDNFGTKRKKLHDEYSTENDKKITAFNNNNLKLTDKENPPQNLKRKSSRIIEDNYINTELNISIDKDSNGTIRLELRHPGSDNSEYKNGHDDEVNDPSAIDNQIEEYSLKDSVDIGMERGDKNGEDASSQDEEYANENDQENDVIHKINVT